MAPKKRSAPSKEPSEPSTAEEQTARGAKRTKGDAKPVAAKVEKGAAQPAGASYWLVKSEPDEYPLEELQKVGQGFWDGVRNYVARNNMREMKVGDLCFFYHSSCKVPGIVGICEVAVEAAVDETALDPKHKYFDAKSDPEKPRWFGVQVKYVRHLKRQVTLEELKSYKSGKLQELDLLHKARLSVQRVSKADWDFILTLEQEEKDS